MRFYDINTFVGHWPFRRLRGEGWSELFAAHCRAGIAGGTVASFDSIFYNDPTEGDDRLFELGSGSQYTPAMSLNPKIPLMLDDAERYGAKVVRIYPDLHGYKLCDDIFTPIADYLTSHDIRLLITARLFIAREAYFLPPPVFDIDDVCAFIAKYPNLKMAILGMERQELLDKKIGEAIRGHGGVYYDLSFTRSAHVTRYADNLGVSTMLFGSAYPLVSLESVRLMLEKSGLSESEKEAAAGGNYLRFMEK